MFKRSYVIRKHGNQTIIDGYATAPYKDFTTKLNVQPLSPDELMALPEGERTVKRIKSFGADKLASANEFTGTPGDLLFYQGYWYECKSSVMWDHTMLRHYQSDFVLCKDQPKEPDANSAGRPSLPPLSSLPVSASLSEQSNNQSCGGCWK